MKKSSDADDFEVLSLRQGTALAVPPDKPTKPALATEVAGFDSQR